MHEMDRTPKIVTIIGLVFEGLSVFGIFLGAYILRHIQDFPFMSADTLDVPQDEFDLMIDIYMIIADVMFYMGIFLALVFLINILIFPKLIRSKFTEEQAKKAYLYQAIWGGFNLLFNQITGILYLISGVTGYNGHREERDIREGI